MSEEVLVDVLDGIMIVTINRPQARNAVNSNVAKGIAAAMDELDSNDKIHVAILTGAEGTFCSGMDLKGFITGDLPSLEGRGFGGVTESPPQKPLIAAVEGYALAGGFELAITCDLVVAAENSQFGIPEVKRGLAAAAGGLVKLPRQIPPRIAMEMALTGEFISASRAYELGLVNKIVASGSALEGAKDLAKLITANGPIAVVASKQVVLQSQDWSTNEMFAKQNIITKKVFYSKDAIEGATAFAEKRAPVWKGE